MSLTNQHKLQLLKDLLQNQIDEQYMTFDEAEQIDRLISILSTDASLKPNIQQMIQQIRHTHKQDTTPFPKEDAEQWVNRISLE